jgi:hypothetical protein
MRAYLARLSKAQAKDIHRLNQAHGPGLRFAGHGTGASRGIGKVITLVSDSSQAGLDIVPRGP